MRHAVFWMPAIIISNLVGLAFANSTEKLVLHPGQGLSDHYIVQIVPPKLAAQTKLTAEQLVVDYGDADTQIRHLYVHTVPGFAVSGLTFNRARWLAADSRVVYVEQDRRALLFQHAPKWGLDRVNQRHLPLDRKLDGAELGRGVHAFIIDTGIRRNHREFRGSTHRLGRGVDLVGDGLRGPEQCPSVETGEFGGAGEHDPLLNAGHGTYVAGVLGGEHYGVANRVTLHPVRVLDCYGEGLASDLIAGVDWVTGYVVRQRKRRSYPALVNMGVGIFGRRGPSGSPLSFLDDAIRSSIAKDITYVVAAGNMGSGEGSTCLDISPARVWEAITVGATRIGDGMDSVPQFSSRGPCVDIHAPGVEILSAWHLSTRDAAVLSGTSVATAFVAGIVARMLEQNPRASPDELVLELYRTASYDVLYDDYQRCLAEPEDDPECTPPTWLSEYTPNRFLYAGTEPNIQKGTIRGVVRGLVLYRYLGAIRDWDVPVSVHEDPFLSSLGAPFGPVDRLGTRPMTPIHAAWHRWEPDIEEISFLRGPRLYRFDYRTHSWNRPLDVSLPHLPWAWCNGPFEATRDPVDVAWHRYEPSPSFPQNARINEIVVMRGTIQYTFDMTNTLRAIGELHEGVWRPSRDMSKRGFMTLPGGPFADKDKRPLSSAYHVRENDRSELVLIRGSTEYRYDYVRKRWMEPRDLSSLTRGAVWSKDRAPFYELDSSEPPDAAWFQELRPTR